MSGKRILITGAAGRIGKALRSGLAGRYELLRLVDRVDIAGLGEGEEAVRSDLATDDLAALMTGIDCVIHLAAVVEEIPLDGLFESNMRSAYRVFEAARLAGVERILYASSVQAVGFHPQDAGVRQGMRIRPSGFYGVTKAFGEALGSMYSDKYGMSVACLRIASFEEKPKDSRHLRTWLSPADCVRLVAACIDAPPFGFEIVYGVSGNTRPFVRDAAPASIAYRPGDDAEPFAGNVVTAEGANALFVGGTFAGVGFTGDLARVPS